MLNFKRNNRFLIFTLMALMLNIKFLSINCFCFPINPSIEIREELNYTCNIYENHKEICEKGFWIEIKQLEETEHNLTIIIKTNETLKNIAPHWEPNVKIKNQTIPDGYIITAIFSGSQFALYLYFGKVKKAIDPFDLYFMFPLKPLCVDENGFLRFTLLLHAFETTNQTSFYFKTSNPSIIKNSSLTCDNLEFKKLDKKITGINSIIFPQFLKDDIENAKASIQCNKTHKALIYIANTFLILNEIKDKIFIFTMIIILLLIVGVIALAKSR